MKCPTCQDTGIVDAGHPCFQVDESCPDCQGPAAEILKLQSQLAIAKAALEFYARGELPYDEWKPGDRHEFGCGCCAGIITEEEGSDLDRSVVGLTAREALEKINVYTSPTGEK